MSQSRQPPKKQPSNRPDWLDDVAREFPVAKGVAPPPTRQPPPRVIVGIPVKPRKHWRWLKRLVWTGVAGIGALMMFVSGMECGYWRAQRKYEAALELNETQIAAVTASADPKFNRDAESSERSAREQVKPAPKPDPPKPAPPEPEPPRPAQAVKFDTHILPIFQAKCITCHSAKPRKGELDLRTLQSAMKGGENGAGILPGDPDSSTVWKYIARDKMPPRGSAKLTPNEKTLIQQWIAAGAK